MDVLGELREFREMNARVAQLEAQGADSMSIRRAMQMPAKPGESDLGYQARILIYNYASDFLQAAEAGGVTLQLLPEDAEQVAQAVGCAYEANRGHRGLRQEDNLVLISKELGCYLALTLCHAMEGKIKVQAVPVQSEKGLSALLVNGIVFQVALPGGRTINTIEVANRVVRSIRVSDTGLTLNQRPILRLLVDRKG